MGKRRLYLFVVLALTALFVAGLFTVSAQARPTLSPDGKTCTPCHTDGRTAESAAAKEAPKAAAPAKESAKPAAKAEATAAKPAAAATKSVKLTLKVAGKDDATLSGYQEKEVLAPLRKVAEALGAQVTDWDKSKKQATVAYKDKSFQMTGKLYGGSAYVPAKELAANLGASFDEKGFIFKKGKGDLAREMWASSGHNVANWGVLTADSPSLRDTCIACHDGQGFANDKTKRADLPEAVKANANSIGCDSCHSVKGKKIMESGNTPVLANGYQVLGAGAGALCTTCHNGRKLPDPAKTPAPHRGPQSDVLYGLGGAEVPGLTYPTSPHGANPNTCASCHMGDVGGAPNHTFKVIDTPQYVASTCGKCHNGLEEVDRTALSDYDGDKKVEGIQEEVAGLMEALKAATDAKLAASGLKWEESHGAVEFLDASGKIVPSPSTEVYNALWNYLLVENDGSEGVHNPAYVVSLLQKSYKALTGKDVPNASPR